MHATIKRLMGVFIFIIGAVLCFQAFGALPTLGILLVLLGLWLATEGDKSAKAMKEQLAEHQEAPPEEKPSAAPTEENVHD